MKGGYFAVWFLGTGKCIWCEWTVCTCSVLCCGERKEAGSHWEGVEIHRGMSSWVALTNFFWIMHKHTHVYLICMSR